MISSSAWARFSVADRARRVVSSSKCASSRADSKCVDPISDLALDLVSATHPRTDQMLTPIAVASRPASRKQSAIT